VSLEGRTVRMARTWTVVSVGPRLGEGGQGVVLSEGGVITAHHLRRDRDYDTVVATVEAHPARPGQVILRSAGVQSWVMRPDGEGAKTVEPGRRLAARTMTIDFGQARGRILGIQTAGPPRGHAPAGEGER
jgi:hypothetical protein